MDAKLWSAVGLFIVCAVLNSIAFAKSTSAPLTNLEASLLQFFMWAAAVVLGLLVSWSLAERSVESAVRHRARPALRRVTVRANGDSGVVTSGQRLASGTSSIANSSDTCRGR